MVFMGSSVIARLHQTTVSLSRELTQFGAMASLSRLAFKVVAIAWSLATAVL